MTNQICADFAVDVIRKKLRRSMTDGPAEGRYATVLKENEVTAVKLSRLGGTCSASLKI